MPTPTQVPLEITREVLSALVLDSDAGGSMIPGVELYEEGTGFRDAADDTMDPEDTAEELVGAGYRIGYEAVFQLPGSTLFISSAVHLFETPQAADAYIERQLPDFNRFAGQEIEEGVTLAEFVPAMGPDVGSGARGGKLVVDFPGGPGLQHWALLASRPGGCRGSHYCDRRDKPGRRSEPIIRSDGPPG